MIIVSDEEGDSDFSLGLSMQCNGNGTWMYNVIKEENMSAKDKSRAREIYCTEWESKLFLHRVGTSFAN